MIKKINVPGRVVDFYKGGEAYAAYRRGEAPGDPEGSVGEWTLFEAIGKSRTRSAKGGWWAVAELDDDAREAARYWAETLETSSADDARSGDPDARSDLRAAQNLLKRLREVA